MASHCINKNSEEYKELLEQSGLNQIVLNARISLYQDKNGEESFPKLSDILDMITSKMSLKEYQNLEKNILKGKEEWTTKEIIDSLIENKYLSKNKRRFLFNAANQLNKLEFNVYTTNMSNYNRISKENNKSGNAYMYIQDKNIYIDREYIKNHSLDFFISSILHEVVHGYTLTEIYSKENPYKERFEEAWNGLKDLQIMKDEYGITNSKELVSELMTNEVFRNKLKRDTLPIWQRIINAFHNLIFGKDYYETNTEAGKLAIKYTEQLIDIKNNIINWNEFYTREGEIENVWDFNNPLNKEISKNSSIESGIELFYNNQELSTGLINQFNSRNQDDTLNVTERKIELMKQSLNAEVLIDGSMDESGKLLPANHPLSKTYNKPVIVINPNKLFSDTVFHEFGHLYIDLLGKEDGVVKQAVNLLQGTEFYNKIAKSYPELSTEDLDKEVLATAIGLEGDKIFTRDIQKLSTWQKIKNFILNKMKDIFNMNGNSIEKLAGEMLSGQVRLTGAEKFNTLIEQKSKYKIEPTSTTKQKDILELFKTLNDTFKKIEVDDKNVYQDPEGNTFSNSVSNDVKKYKKNHISKNKGDIELKFDKTLYSTNSIMMHLNSPKIPLALAKALNDFVDDDIVISGLTKRDSDLNWLDVYNRDGNETAAEQLARESLESITGVKSLDFEQALINNFDAVMDRAEMYQLQYNQAPIVGNILHNASENFVNNGIDFPANINDKDDNFKKILRGILDKGRAAGSVFITEQILFSENRQRPGTADLIEITKDGEFRIYDYKTISNFKWGQNPKSDHDLYFFKGYAHQILAYGAMLNQYGISAAQDPYHIIMAEVKYSNVQDENSNIYITEVRNKSLSDKNLLSSLNDAKRMIYNDYASSKQLDAINIKPDINDLSDIVDRINNYISIYKKRTKNISSNLDISRINVIKNDLIKNKLESDLNKYVAKNNQVIIKSYVDNIHNTLVILERQKEMLGDSLSSEYLQSLNYLLQVTDVLTDIKKILEGQNDEIHVDDKNEILAIVNATIHGVELNKTYYKEKTQRLAVNLLAENSNLMYGLYNEKYQTEARNKGLKTKEEKDAYALTQLKANKNEIDIKEMQYWTAQYENGFADIRFLEYMVSDPGMNKSQFVQLIKNILDKTDNSIRNKLMDVLPDVNNWYKGLKFEKTGDPKKVWDKLIERKTIVNIETRKKATILAGSVIPEFISDYRKLFLDYENVILEYERVINKLKIKTVRTKEEDSKLTEMMERVYKLREERTKVLKDKTLASDDFVKQRENPEFTKLSADQKESLRFIHKNLDDADARLFADPSKKLVKELKDGTKIYYLPKERMGALEAAYSGNTIGKRFISKIEDMMRPPSDEDEFNVDNEEFNHESKHGSFEGDIYGSQVFTIPVYHRQNLEDESLQSYDIPSLLIMNHETTITFEESKLNEADLFVIAESLNSKNNDKILKTDSFVSRKIQDATGKVFMKSDQNLTYQAVKSSIENRLYKRTYRGVYSKNNYRLIKAGETISQAASTIVLAGNFMSALSTFSQGSIYRFIEGSVGEHMNLNDWKTGSKKSYADIANVMKDTQRNLPESKTNLLIRKFGLETHGKSLTNKFIQDNVLKRNLDQSTVFGVTSVAEAMITANLMYSLLNNIKVTNEQGEFIDKDGKIVSKDKAMSLDEAYEAVDGKLILNSNVKYTNFNITEKYNSGLDKDNTIAATEISRYIRSVYADLYGQYNQDMKSVLQRSIIGKMAMSLRGWLPRGLHHRFRGITDTGTTFEEMRDESNIEKRFYSQDQKQFQEGTYTTTIRYLRSMYKTMKQNQIALTNISAYSGIHGQVIKTMTDHEIANLKRTNAEIAMIAITLAIAMLLKGLAENYQGDDEDKEKIYFLAYLTNRVNTEMMTFISPNSMITMVKSPAASLSVIERSFKALEQILWYSSTKNDQFDWGIDDVYETGNKEGENKALIKTLGLIPGYVKYNQAKSILGFDSNNSMEDSFKSQLRNK